MHIRCLKESDMKEAVKLKIQCWTEELAGEAENSLSLMKELPFWINWMNTEKQHKDIRMLIGAYEGDTMMGVAFASLAEEEDLPEKGIELNGLWVKPIYRGRGVAYSLIKVILDFYQEQGMEKIVIYNLHHSPSNGFYKKLGAKVMREDLQMDGKLRVDVFVGEIMEMLMRINHYKK